MTLISGRVSTLFTLCGIEALVSIFTWSHHTSDLPFLAELATAGFRIYSSSSGSSQIIWIFLEHQESLHFIDISNSFPQLSLAEGLLIQLCSMYELKYLECLLTCFPCKAVPSCQKENFIKYAWLTNFLVNFIFNNTFISYTILIKIFIW